MRVSEIFAMGGGGGGGDCCDECDRCRRCHRCCDEDDFEGGSGRGGLLGGILG